MHFQVWNNCDGDERRDLWEYLVLRNRVIRVNFSLLIPVYDINIGIQLTIQS